jgi:hypothetical protein
MHHRMKHERLIENDVQYQEKFKWKLLWPILNYYIINLLEKLRKVLGALTVYIHSLFKKVKQFHNTPMEAQGEEEV